MAKRNEHYQVGDIIKYEHDGGEHKHTIHGVRYEEANGRRINIRYIIGIDYLEHDTVGAHEHNILCPIVEREVRHEKVTEKTGSVKIPTA